MRFILVVLLLFSPLLAVASEAEEKRLCKHLLPDECESVLARYWWGSKFDEVDVQLAEVSELFRNAIISNDYTRIEKYISFPFEFFVEDGTTNETFLRRDNKQYKWIADDIKEFGYWFHKFLETKSGQVDLGSEDDYSRLYYRSGRVNLIKARHTISIKVQCKDFKPSEKKKFYVLPDSATHVLQHLQAKKQPNKQAPN